MKDTAGTLLIKQTTTKIERNSTSVDRFQETIVTKLKVKEKSCFQDCIRVSHHIYVNVNQCVSLPEGML